MSYTNLATLGAYEAAIATLVKDVSGARRELLLEVYQCGWEPATAGVLKHKATGKTLHTMALMEKLTDDSADPNYIRLVVHMMKCGWEVQPDGQISHRDGHGPMPVRLALIACLSVGSGV